MTPTPPVAASMPRYRSHKDVWALKIKAVFRKAAEQQRE
jgi:hypothetical protein